jgi:hypothetical protein
LSEIIQRRLANLACIDVLIQNGDSLDTIHHLCDVGDGDS